MNGDIFTTRAPEVRFTPAGAPPPSPLYIGAHEALVVDTWSSTAPAALAVVARVLTPGGEVHTSRWSHTPNTDRTRATTYHQLEEGFLLSVAVDATGAAYRRGHCWCQVGIQIGDGAVGVAHAQLISDYVTGAARLAWPGGQIRSSVEGPGLIRSITGTDPAAGADISETVPTGARWRLTALRAVLTTDATVANRIPVLSLDDGANTLSRVGTGGTVVAASSAIAFSWGNTGVQGDTGQAYNGALLAYACLPGTYRIQVLTVNLQVGDNWGAPQLWVEEWIDP